MPAEAYGLWGMNYLDGYIVDEAGAKDLILVGRRQRDRTAAPARPGLRLDDLILALRAMHAADYPYCSLDPEAQSIRKLQALTAGSHTASSLAELRSFYDQLKSTVGPQQVVIGGVPRDSRWGHVMIEADYHMKKVSQGHIALTGVTSYLDLAMEQASKAVLAGRTAEATKCSMARFWFHVEADAPTFDEARDIVYIDRCAVVVLTEKQAATSSGRLHDVTEDDPLAGAFARSLSDEFAALTASVPIYADLENLFRLRALTLAAAFRTAPARVGLAPATLADGYKFHDDKTMPPSLSGLANSREATVGAYLLCPMVLGGVGQDMTVDETSFRTLHRSRLFSLRMAALMARPSNESVVWVVREAA